MSIKKYEMFRFLIIHVGMIPKFKVSIIPKYPILKHTNKYTASLIYSNHLFLAARNVQPETLTAQSLPNT